MANIPYKASEEDLRTFFKDLIIPADGVTFLMKNRLMSGHAFVKFSSVEDAVKAEKLHDQVLAGRKILVKQSYVQFLRETWRRVVQDEAPFPEERFIDPNDPASAINSLQIRNLDKQTEYADVVNLLRKKNINFKKVHLIIDDTNTKIVYVELVSADEAAKAVKFNGKMYLNNNVLNIFAISYSILQRDLSLSSINRQPPMPFHGPFINDLMSPQAGVSNPANSPLYPFQILSHQPPPFINFQHQPRPHHSGDSFR